jgi:hypothetical protein
MPVESKHAQFTKALASWVLVSDACAGEAAVKSKKKTYLPQPNPDDTSTANEKRYDQYLKRAVFYNVTRRTLSGLVGTAFRKPPETTLPAQLDYLNEDASGAGVGLAQQSQAVLSAVLKKGRHGLLVDYPQIENASAADVIRLAIRPTIVEYDAEHIINWRISKVGGEWKLSLVVLYESISQPAADGFDIDVVQQYRVLRLVDGVYQQEVWRKPSASSDWVMAEATLPRQANGSTWNIIPFTFVGSINNDSDIDPSPLYDLASLNLAHYRNSADYEDSVFFTGQVQPWISGLSEEWRDHLEKEGIYIGSRTPILLPEGGAFGFAQAAPNTLCGEAMATKEKQMAAIGARLIEAGSSVKTATEAQGDLESEMSVLSSCANNVNAAYAKCLEWCGLFLGVTTESTFKILTDYVESRLDPQVLTALVALWQSGKYPTSDFWAQLRAKGLIDPEKTDEDIQDELDAEVPTGVNLDNPAVPPQPPTDGNDDIEDEQ